MKIVQILAFVFFIIKGIFFLHATNNICSDDVSACIVDLKFDGSKIAICEFGECLESEFKGYDSLYGKNAAWKMIWHALAEFDTPLWYVDSRHYKHSSRGLNIFMSLGGICTKSLEILSNDHFFNKLKRDIPSYGHNKGIVAVRSLGITSYGLGLFKEKNPHILLLGYGTNYFVRSKYRTHDLFNEPDLALLRPSCTICDKNYSPELASKIINSLNSDVVVIKPLNAARGNGVIIIPSNQLDTTLQILFNNAANRRNRVFTHHSDSAYTYWNRDKNKHFIVEAFAASKTIIVNQKPYDPTMRVIFIASCLNGKTKINFLDAYWKLPEKSLNDNGSFNEKHKSNIQPHVISSAVVDKNDFTNVKALLSKALPKLYNKMLAMHPKRTRSTPN